MLKLVLADLRQNAAKWVWTLLVAVVGGTCLSILTSSRVAVMDWVNLQPDNSTLRDAVDALVGQIMGYVGVAMAAVVSASANMTVSANNREYALWKVLGVPARRIQGVLLAQLGLLGLVGGSVGSLLGPRLAPLYLQTWHDFPNRGNNITAALQVPPVPIEPLGIICVTALCVVIGGLAAALKAARLPEMQALRESEAPRVRVGKLSAGFALLFTVGGGAALFSARTMPQAEAPAAVGAGLLVILMAALTVSSLTLRPLLFAWTAPIPRRWTAAFVAREACRYRSGQSMATILPFALALSMVGNIYGIVAGSGGGQVTGMSLIFSLIFAVSLVGGVANIALMSNQRSHDLALLGVLGASEATKAALPLLEGTIYALTGLWFGLLYTVFTVVVVANVAHQSAWHSLILLPWPTLLGLAVGSWALSVGAVWLTRGRAQTEQLSVLRQPV